MVRFKWRLSSRRGRTAKHFAALGSGTSWLHGIPSFQKLGTVIVMGAVTGSALLVKAVQMIYARRGETRPPSEAAAADGHAQSDAATPLGGAGMQTDAEVLQAVAHAMSLLKGVGVQPWPKRKS